MKSRTRLLGLQEISALKFRAVQAEMAKLLAQEAALRRNYEQLVASRQSQTEAERSPDEPAMIAGADIRWHRWVDQRRAVINAELAQVLAQKAACHARLQKVFGRDQAALALLKQDAKARKAIDARRTAYES